ncbi:MAG TPA: hypothetical protein VF331_16340 [Polyangiales bacterium]
METSVLIAERDSRWLDWARAWRAPAHELVVLVQHEKESQGEFFERVKQRLESLGRQGRRLKQVVLTGGSVWDAEAVRMRAQMIRGILTRFARTAQSAWLWLDAGAKSGVAALGMKAIADAVGECTAGASTQLRLVAGPTY